jgi:HlyD family secretion protein
MPSPNSNIAVARKRRAWLPILIVIVLLASAYAWYRHSQATDDYSGYRTEAVSRGELSVVISATGALSATSTVDIGTQVSGTVASVDVDFNDRVSKGQVIARIDPASVQARVNQASAVVASARAAQAQAQAALRNAEADYARKRDLLKRQLIARSDADLALAARDQARAQVASAGAGIQQQQAALASAQADLRNSVIRSPVDGVVLNRTVNPGQTVAASLQTPVLFQIAEDLQQMQIVLAVDEADIGQIRPGQAVSFSVDAFPERSYRGRIKEVRLSASNTNNVITYPVVVQVDNSDLSLFPGMTANAEIEVDQRADVLRVANAALRYKPAKTNPSANPNQNNAPRASSGGDGAPPRSARGGGMIAAELPRIAAELKLDARQQAILDELLAKQKQRGDAMRASGRAGAWAQRGGRDEQGAAGESAQRSPERSRQRGQQRMKEMYAPFRAALDPQQQAQWDREIAKLATLKRGTVYLLVAGKPVATQVRLGLSDGSYTEVGGGNIKEGDLAILGENRPSQ